MNIEFEYTWCEYLTPCPNGRDCFVGDFDCSICPHFVNLIATNKSAEESESVAGDYSKYCKVFTGEISCKYKKVNK